MVFLQHSNMRQKVTVCKSNGILGADMATRLAFYADAVEIWFSILFLNCIHWTNGETTSASITAG